MEKSSRQFDVSVSGGYHSLKVKDPTFTNVSQTGTGWTFGTGVTIKGTSFTHRFAIHHAVGDLQGSAPTGQSKYSDAGYWLLKNIYTKGDDPLYIAVGAGVSAFSFSRSYQDLINNNYTKEAALCLDIGVNIVWSPLFSNQKLKLTNFLRSNIYSFSAQPLYGAYAWQIPSDQPNADKTMFSSAQGTGPQNSLNIVNEFSITYAISGLLSVGVQNQFSYGKMAINRQVTWNTNNIVAICKLTF